MSSEGHRVSGTASAGSPFWCHMCQKVVNVVPEASGDVHCPECGSEFVEEYSEPSSSSPATATATATATETGTTASSSSSSSMSGSEENSDPHVRNILNLFRAVDSHQQQNRARGRGRQQASIVRIDLFPNGAQPGQDMENPFLPFIRALQQGAVGVNGFGVPAHLLSMLNGGRPARAGAGAGGARGMEQISMDELLDYLFRTSQARGAPPAAKSAVEALKKHTITEEEVKQHAEDDFACTVCQETFAAGDSVIEMPCKHVFHVDCLSPWLAMHNSCPSCRLELPTDDPDYEDFKKARRTM